jgi:hypothetical protein
MFSRYNVMNKERIPSRDGERRRVRQPADQEREVNGKGKCGPVV